MYLILSFRAFIIFSFYSGNIPGNIRSADFFIMFMRRLIDYLKMRLAVTHAVQESPAGILRDLKTRAFIDRKPLRCLKIKKYDVSLAENVFY